jgi:hypothetical protein
VPQFQAMATCAPVRHAQTMEIPMTKNRLETFSDGVLAIAITLLVIDIRPPEVPQGEQLAHALWMQWPSYVAYLVSFLTIGVIWLNHHRVVDQVVRVDGPLLLLNLHLLLWTALIPFHRGGRPAPGRHRRGGPDGVGALQRSPAVDGGGVRGVVRLGHPYRPAAITEGTASGPPAVHDR